MSPVSGYSLGNAHDQVGWVAYVYILEHSFQGIVTFGDGQRRRWLRSWARLLPAQRGGAVAPVTASQPCISHRLNHFLTDFVLQPSQRRLLHDVDFWNKAIDQYVKYNILI